MITKEKIFSNVLWCNSTQTLNDNKRHYIFHGGRVGGVQPGAGHGTKGQLPPTSLWPKPCIYYNVYSAPRVFTPNGTSIPSVIFAVHGRMTDRQTYRQTHHAVMSSIAIGWIECVKISYKMSSLTKYSLMSSTKTLEARLLHLLVATRTIWATSWQLAVSESVWRYAFRHRMSKTKTGGRRNTTDNEHKRQADKQTDRGREEERDAGRRSVSSLLEYRETI